MCIRDSLMMDPQVLPATCAGESDGIVELVVEEGAALSFEWSGGLGSEQVIMNVASGTYSVLVTNDGLCEETFEYFVDEPEPLMVGLLDSVQTTCGYELGMLEVMAVGGTPPYSYVWLDGTTGPVLNDLAAGTYIVSVEDAMACTQEVGIDMLCSEPDILLPYEFISPDDNGLNDQWIIINGSDYPDLLIHVYNRWGGLVFQHSGAYFDTWEGTNLKGEPLPSATYFWVVESTTGQFEPLQGFLEIQH